MRDKTKVDDASSSVLSSASQAHPCFPKSSRSLDDIASIRIFNQFVLEPAVVLIADQCDNRKARKFNEFQR